jgi:hypothetical protein
VATLRKTSERKHWVEHSEEPDQMESPRAAYAARNSTREQASMKLMTALDAPRVELIKRDFELRNNQVDPPDFISIMLTHLPSHLYSDHDHAAGATILNIETTKLINQISSQC